MTPFLRFFAIISKLVDVNKALIFLIGFGTAFILVRLTAVENYKLKSTVTLNVERTVNINEIVNQTEYPKNILKEEMKEIQKREQELSEKLFKNHRILCMILTTVNAIERQKAIVETWGKRCHTLLFLIGKNDTTESHKINSFAYMITLPMFDNYHGTWTKVRLGSQYVAEHYRGQFDWFIRADDDTFIIMENLRLFLSSRNPKASEMYGVHYKLYGEYIGTGSGFIISAHNFDSLINSFNLTNCNKYETHNDDVEICNCLKLAGVKVADTRDEKNRFRFFPFNPDATINRKLTPTWIWGWSKFSMSEGFECCSDDYVGFHYVTPEVMRTMEFLIYYSHPFSGREVWKRPYN